MEHLMFYEQISQLGQGQPVKIFDTVMGSDYEYFRLHWHKEVELLKLSGGIGNYTINSVSYQVGDGDIVIISPQMLHYGKVDQRFPLSCRVVQFSLDTLKNPMMPEITKKFIQPFENEELMFTPIIKAEDYPEISAAIDRLAEWNLYDSDENSFLIQSELCKIYGNLIKNKLYQSLARAGSMDSNSIKDIISYIGDHLIQKITVDELAAVAGYSRYHFLRYFKQHTGTTCVHYINTMRLSLAANLLINTGLPVSIIGENVGIPNTSYFIKIFTGHYHLTPLDFRKYYSV